MKDSRPEPRENVRSNTMAALAHELESLHELEGEWEAEGELEGEGEWESEVSPVRKIYADGMMEHLAHMAAEAESEQEAAEQFHS
jgi:hypothetical protein